MDEKLISRISAKYQKYSLWITAALSLAMIFAMSMGTLSMDFLNPLVVSALYTLAATVVYGLSWKGVAKSSPKTLTRFYLVASALRMLTAVMVVVVYCVIIKTPEAIRNFVLVFFAFYLVMLIFDGIFFARMEKTNNLKYKK